MLYSLRFRLLLTLIGVVAVAVATVALFASRVTSRELQRYVELGGLGDGPGAACDQAKRGAPELDAEARRARLGGEAERMVAFQHEA